MKDLNSAAFELVTVLRDAGHEVWQVGGCVRDRLLGHELKDIDIATDARPEKVAVLFEDVRLVGAGFGVCLVRLGTWTLEVATFRKDGRYIDHRHPENVEYGTLEEDARRRDFTINALYYDPVDDVVRDLTDGRADLEAKRIRTVGEPAKRFNEDALRLLRAVRFAAGLGFEIEPDTWSAMCQLASTIRHISPERQRDELTRMLTGPDPSRAFRLLDESGLLVELLPEVVALHGVEQGKRFHPEGDVFEHTMLCLENLENRSTVRAWAMLLHDIGKPRTFQRREGRITFYQHEHVGAEMAGEICRRFRFSSEETRRICDIVSRHMKFINTAGWKASTLRRFIAADTIEDDLAVHRADVLSSHGMLSAWEHITRAMQRHRDPESGRSGLPAPLVTGDDLLAVGYKPGPIFKTILDRVQEEQLDGNISNREEALEFVRSHFPPEARL